jgi:hypothetical protein
MVWVEGSVVIGVGVCSQLQAAVSGRKCNAVSVWSRCGRGWWSIAFTDTVAWQFVGRRRRCRRPRRLVSGRRRVSSSQQE